MWSALPEMPLELPTERSVAGFGGLPAVPLEAKCRSSGFSCNALPAVPELPGERPTKRHFVAIGCRELPEAPQDCKQGTYIAVVIHGCVYKLVLDFFVVEFGGSPTQAPRQWTTLGFSFAGDSRTSGPQQGCQPATPVTAL